MKHDVFFLLKLLNIVRQCRIEIEPDDFTMIVRSKYIV